MPTFLVGGASIGAGLLSDKLSPMLPPGVTDPLAKTSQTLSTFVAPIATIGSLGIVTKQLKKIERRTNKWQYKTQEAR